MRKLAHPVTVIHAVPSTGSPSGMVATSFTTITIDPVPLVSFNIKLPSRTYDAIANAGTFTVSAICSEPVAKHFARYWMTKTPWRKSQPPRDEYGAYLAHGRVWALECEWMKNKSIELGDHMVMIGKVKNFIPPSEKSSQFQALNYQDRRYRVAGMAVEKVSEVQIEQKRRRETLEESLGFASARSDIP
jgi:flavin reductase (DIM6/NTAB) family NADH-FMN oxidoreductase RutF